MTGRNRWAIGPAPLAEPSANRVKMVGMIRPSLPEAMLAEALLAPPPAAASSEADLAMRVKGPKRLPALSGPLAALAGLCASGPGRMSAADRLALGDLVHAVARRVPASGTPFLADLAAFAWPVGTAGSAAHLVRLARACADMPAALARFHGAGRLDAAFVLAAFCAGERGLAAAALARLSGLDSATAVRRIAKRGPHGLRGLCDAAGLSADVWPVVRAAARAGNRTTAAAGDWTRRYRHSALVDALAA